MTKRRSDTLDNGHQRVGPFMFTVAQDLPIDGYFFFTAALTFFFSAVVPDWATRERAFLAWAASSIGNFFLLGSAKSLVGIALRAVVESFDIFTFSNGQKPLSDIKDLNEPV